MPNENFVDRWVAYAKERTEAPEIFHRYMAYMAVAVTLGNRAWIPWTNGKLFPNLYILFMSESASFKSTAINMIRDVVNEVDENIEVPSDVTSASLANVFRKYKQGFFSVDEFSVVLKAEESHFSTVKVMMTSVYDCPKKYKLPYRMQEQEGDKLHIEHPVFSLAGAITPHTFVKDAHPEDMKGGFLSRFITVPGKKSGRSIPVPPGVDWGLVRGFAASLKRLRDPHFWDPHEPMVLSDDAMALRTEWYNQIKHLMDTNHEYIELSNAVNRIRTYAIKFAMLNAVADRVDHTISRDDIQVGIDIANAAIDSVIHCMKDLEVSCSDDKWVKSIAKAEKYIEDMSSRGPVSKTELYRHIKHISKQDMDKVLMTLKDSGKVKIDAGPNGSMQVAWQE